jgi:uncharacterized protein YodC (DUF2158 family)
MAAPFVAGGAALVLAACPANTASLRSILLASVDTHASLTGTTVSGGRLNVRSALESCLPPLTTVHATANGRAVTATVTHGPGAPRDWLALYCPASSADASHTDWFYLNGSKSAPASGLTSATVTFQAPVSSANCNVRLFANDQLQKLATSETVTVQSPSTLTIADASVTEGNSGTSVATFTVTVSPANASQTVTVNYATANGTATVAGNDYAAASGTLTFAPSVATQTVSVTVNGDPAVESNETFVVNLSDAINATIADAQATGTIVNDDAGGGAAVTVATPSVNPGGTISFSVSGGPANPSDWLALVVTSGPDSGYVKWMYLNGTTTMPASGVSSASLQFTAPTTPGSYEIRWFAANSYQRLATSGTITVGSQRAVTVASPNVNPGGTISFSVSGGPGNPSDWVALVATSAADSAYVKWMYLNGTTTMPASGLANASLQFTAPTTSGTYEVRWFAANSYQRLATSSAIAVGSQSATVTLGSSSVNPGGTIAFSVSGGPANPSDWVALVATSAPDSGYVRWMYLNGSTTMPGSGLANASLQFTAPTTPGTYEIRWFAANSYQRLATSGAITVGSQSPTVTLGSPGVSSGGAISFSVSGGPANPSDWVALVATSGPDSGYVQWMYLNGLKTMPANGIASASLQFTAPTTPGNYEIRWFAANSYQRLATSGTITVGS